MHQYFRLFQNSSKGLIAGNVELVEDRIPGTLLSFPPKGFREEAVMPHEGWPRTGFVYDAVFYIEAEKPLSQLVKQRRRWLNGTFATYLWMLMERIVTRSNQDPFNRFLSWLLVIINVVQGMVVRLCGPALLIVWYVWQMNADASIFLTANAYLLCHSFFLPGCSALGCSFPTFSTIQPLFLVSTLMSASYFVLCHRTGRLSHAPLLLYFFIDRSGAELGLARDRRRTPQVWNYCRVSLPVPLRRIHCGPHSPGQASQA